MRTVLSVLAVIVFSSSVFAVDRQDEYNPVHAIMSKPYVSPTVSCNAVYPLLNPDGRYSGSAGPNTMSWSYSSFDN